MSQQGPHVKSDRSAVLGHFDWNSGNGPDAIVKTRRPAAAAWWSSRVVSRLSSWAARATRPRQPTAFVHAWT